MEDIGDLACKTCKDPHESNPMLICDKCADAYHIDCINMPEVPKGAFYC